MATINQIYSSLAAFDVLIEFAGTIFTTIQLNVEFVVIPLVCVPMESVAVCTGAYILPCVLYGHPMHVTHCPHARYQEVATLVIFIACD